MVKSAPRISFTVDSIDYGTIDVGNTTAVASYYVLNHNSASIAIAINMSISFKESSNASEARKESWVFISTAEQAYARIASVGGPEAFAGSVLSGAAQSILVKTYVNVPVAAASAGRVAWQLHHRYQYTG